MRNYVWIRWQKNQSLVVVRSTWFFDLLTETSIKAKNIDLDFLKTKIWNDCMEVIEKNNLEYIIWWMNETYVAIRNRSQRVFTIWWKKYRIWRAYWIKKIKAESVLDFDIKWIKYPYYTVFNWNDFFHLLLSAMQFWYWFVEEKDIKKIKRLSKKSKVIIKLNDFEKQLVKQVEIYSKRIATLNMIEDPTEEEQVELDRYFDVNPMNAFKISDWLKIDYWWTVNKIKEKSVWKKNYKEVINSF